MPFNIFETDLVTIASGQALSDAANVQGRDVVGIVMPAGWDAAALTLRASADGQNFADVFNIAGTEVSYTVAAGRYIPIEAGTLSGMQSLILRSGTTATPVNQTANRVIGVVLRPNY